jgi:hypothetical protein
MDQSGAPPPDDYRRTPRGAAAHVLAPAGIGIAGVLVVLTIALIGFAQVFPAIVTFFLAMMIGVPGVAAAFAKRQSQPEGDYGPVVPPPSAEVGSPPGEPSVTQSNAGPRPGRPGSIGSPEKRL